MIVGEAPGFNEDRQGEPFVGAAGKLLDTLLARIELSRADVYITNVLKCRPPMNRDPMPNEVEACSPYLKEQMALVKPKVEAAQFRHAADPDASVEPGHGDLVRFIQHCRYRGPLRLRDGDRDGIAFHRIHRYAHTHGSEQKGTVTAERNHTGIRVH